jgi:hypothetical protein
MAESLPNPPTSPAPAAPAFDPKAIIDQFVAVLTKPADFFASAAIKEQKGFGPPLIFAVIMGLVAGVIGAILAVLHLGAAGGPLGGAVGVGVGLMGIIISPIMAVIVAFVGGAIVHVIALIASGKGTYEQSVRIACYATAVYPVAAVLGIISFLPLSILANLWGMYIVALGIIALHSANRQTTFIVLGVLAAIWLLITVIGFFTMKMAAGAASGAIQQMKEAAEQAQKAAEAAKQAQ